MHSTALARARQSRHGTARHCTAWPDSDTGLATRDGHSALDGQDDCRPGRRHDTARHSTAGHGSTARHGTALHCTGTAPYHTAQYSSTALALARHSRHCTAKSARHCTARHGTGTARHCTARRGTARTWHGMAARLVTAVCGKQEMGRRRRAAAAAPPHSSSSVSALLPPAELPSPALERGPHVEQGRRGDTEWNAG